MQCKHMLEQTAAVSTIATHVAITDPRWSGYEVAAPYSTKVPRYNIFVQLRRRPQEVGRTACLGNQSDFNSLVTLMASDDAVEWAGSGYIEPAIGDDGPRG